uniref:SH3 domain-containing protein n=1 Tax=Monopterus albus TaxID=43700 RepID=A0A3Q3IWA8_MONAL
MEKERQWQEKLRRDEEERQRRLQEERENWWLGELNGEQGWFPKTYIFVPLSVCSIKSPPPDSSESSDSLQLEGNKSSSLMYITAFTGIMCNFVVHYLACNSVGVDVHAFVLLSEYVALYTYESPEPGDLIFTEGDVILVSKREGEWWNGSIGNRTGLFPGNYVKPKETDVRAHITY